MGLRGTIAGATAICTVGVGSEGLHYRGYSVEDLAEHTIFEEVAHLLHYGNLPNAAEFERYLDRLRAIRSLPAALKEVLQQIPATAHPMDVLRNACSLLGTLEPEGDFTRQHDVADRLLAALPSMMGYWCRNTKDGTRIDSETPDHTNAGHILRLITGRNPVDKHRRFMEA